MQILGFANTGFQVGDRATDVSRGRRYVLLSFFHGAAEDRRRRGG